MFLLPIFMDILAFITEIQVVSSRNMLTKQSHSIGFVTEKLSVIVDKI